MSFELKLSSTSSLVTDKSKILFLVNNSQQSFMKKMMILENSIEIQEIFDPLFKPLKIIFFHNSKI